MCPPLPTFTNGMISYSPDFTPNFDLGTDATYTCDAGFFLDVTAASQIRRCIDDNGMDAIGVWSGQEPSCIRKLSTIKFFKYFCRCFIYHNIVSNFRWCNFSYEQPFKYFFSNSSGFNVHSTVTLLFLQLLSVLPSTLLPMDLSPTLPTPHLTMIWALWLLMPVTVGSFCTSP